MTSSFNEENIRIAAYYIWEQAGRPEGKEKDCWIKACEQLFAVGQKDCGCSKKSPSKTTAKSAVVKPSKSATIKSEKPVTTKTVKSSETKATPISSVTSAKKTV